MQVVDILRQQPVRAIPDRINRLADDDRMPEHEVLVHRIWSETNREELLKKKRAWAAKNREKVRKKKRAFYKKNKKKECDRVKKIYQTNPDYREAAKARSAKRYAENKEEINAKKKAARAAQRAERANGKAD